MIARATRYATSAAIGGAMLLAPMIFSAPTASAYGPGVTVSIALGNTSVGDAGQTGVTGSGFKGQTNLAIHSLPESLGSVVADASGNFSTTVTIPADVPAGAHTITATDAFGDTASAAITITAASSGSGSSAGSGASLPATGTDVAATAAVGAGAIGLGGLLVLFSRKRRLSSFSA